MSDFEVIARHLLRLRALMLNDPAAVESYHAKEMSRFGASSIAKVLQDCREIAALPVPTTQPDDEQHKPVARYLTRAGEALRNPNLTVDIYENDPSNPEDRFHYTCRGCTALTGLHSLPEMRSRALKHAAECRGIPAP